MLIFLYKEILKTKISRNDFLLQLASELKDTFKNDSEFNEEASQLHNSLNFKSIDSKTRRQCQIKRCNGNKTIQICQKCKKNVCGKCIGKIEKMITCLLCFEKA